MKHTKDTGWFSHDSNARNDEKILALRAEFGWAGYGIYWALVEKMREEPGYRIRRRFIPAIAVSLNLDPDELHRIISFCIDPEINLFECDDDYVWARSLRERMIEKDRKQEQAKAAAAKRWGNSPSNPDDDDPKSSNPCEKCRTDADALRTHCKCNADADPDAMLKEKKREEEKVIEEKREEGGVGGEERSAANTSPSESPVHPITHTHIRGLEWDDAKSRYKLLPLAEHEGKSQFNPEAVVFMASQVFDFPVEHWPVIEAWVERMERPQVPRRHDVRHLGRLIDRFGDKETLRAIRRFGKELYLKPARLDQMLQEQAATQPP